MASSDVVISMSEREIMEAMAEYVTSRGLCHKDIRAEHVKVTFRNGTERALVAGAQVTVPFSPPPPSKGGRFISG